MPASDMFLRACSDSVVKLCRPTLEVKKSSTSLLGGWSYQQDSSISGTLPNGMGCQHVIERTQRQIHNNVNLLQRNVLDG